MLRTGEGQRRYRRSAVPCMEAEVHPRRSALCAGGLRPSAARRICAPHIPRAAWAECAPVCLEQSRRLPSIQRHCAKREVHRVCLCVRVHPPCICHMMDRTCGLCASRPDAVCARICCMQRPAVVFRATVDSRQVGRIPRGRSIGSGSEEEVAHRGAELSAVSNGARTSAWLMPRSRQHALPDRGLVVGQCAI